ncbi:S1-like domain-containing RNA-binding protein [Pseudomonas sp. F1_0610]|uniref:CvfB family protein n=1 Tax=Pseudomonas sp. F1_0610 TaxID=3114284 RepID=UPI0039C3B6DB
MALIGQMNTLQVLRKVDFGVYLDGTVHGDILLPNREITKNTELDEEDWVNAFVYRDSEDKLIATMHKPKVQVGQFASLKVVDINRVGLFLDWGLSKDLLLPHSEEKRPLQVGDYCMVYVYLDPHTERITASARLDRHLKDTATNEELPKGMQVDLLVAERTDLGFKAIINGKYWGLIHKNELFRFVRPGMQIEGYVRLVRDDGRISLSLQKQGHEMRDELGEQILQRLKDNGGSLALSDKSDPQIIANAFNVSKGNFKKSIGGLFKQGLIIIYDDHIELKA